MDWGSTLNYFYEIAYFLVVFGIFLLFSVFKGRQAIINLIVGLYLALLISIEFPGYERLFSSIENSHTLAAAKLGFFAFISLFTTLFCWRIMPDEFGEERFESLGKKSLLAFAATLLVMAFSFHVLPVTEFLTPGTPIQSLFAPEVYYFWWLLVPLVIVYIL